MIRRSAKEQGEQIQPAHVGEVDPVSRAARSAGVPICEATKIGDRCTRASGHREAGRDHPAHDHVHAPRPNYIAKAIW